MKYYWAAILPRFSCRSRVQRNRACRRVCRPRLARLRRPVLSPRSFAASASTRRWARKFRWIFRFSMKTGHDVKLGQYFGKPVILALVYYSVPFAMQHGSGWHGAQRAGLED